MLIVNFKIKLNRIHLHLALLKYIYFEPEENTKKNIKEFQ